MATRAQRLLPWMHHPATVFQAIGIIIAIGAAASWLLGLAGRHAVGEAGGAALVIWSLGRHVLRVPGDDTSA